MNFRHYTKRAELRGKAILNWTARVLVRPRRRRLDLSRVRGVLVMRYDRLGDLVATLPLLKALRKHMPNARVGLLGTPRNVGLVEGTGVVDDVFVYDKRRPLPTIPRLLVKVRPRHYDLVLDMLDIPSLTGGVLLAALAPGSQRLKIHPGDYAHFYTHTMERNPVDEHMIERFSNILSDHGIVISGDDLNPRLPLLEDDVECAKRFEKALPEGRRIGYNLSAGKEYAVYPIELMIELARRLHSDDPRTVALVFSVPRERGLARRFAGAVPNSHVVPPTEIEAARIRVVAAYVDLCDLLITPDTAKIHFATALNLPVVGVYTPRSGPNAMWLPYRVAYRAVFAEPGLPASTIPPDAVHEAARDLWREVGDAARRKR